MWTPSTPRCAVERLVARPPCALWPSLSAHVLATPTLTPTLTSAGGHGPMLCAGFADGSLRRFAVADLQLEQQLTQ